MGQGSEPLLAGGPRGPSRGRDTISTDLDSIPNFVGAVPNGVLFLKFTFAAAQRMDRQSPLDMP